jgi:hypothetical protein
MILTDFRRAAEDLRRWRRTSGFALPATLVVIAGLMLLATGAFLSARLELVISRSHEGSVRAFYLAEAGLATALADASVPIPGWREFTFVTGSSQVTAVPLIAVDSVTTLYRLESRGMAGGPVFGGAVRTVTVLASRRGRGNLRPLAGSWREIPR